LNCSPANDCGGISENNPIQGMLPQDIRIKHKYQIKKLMNQLIGQTRRGVMYLSYRMARVGLPGSLGQRKLQKNGKKEELKLMCHLPVGQGFGLHNGGQFLECWCLPALFSLRMRVRAYHLVGGRPGLNLFCEPNVRVSMCFVNYMPLSAQFLDDPYILAVCEKS
jgi:hypothetical protein